jgi:hypothetical protein
LQGTSYVTNGATFTASGNTVLSKTLTTIDTTNSGASPLGANVTFVSGNGSGRINGTTAGAQALSVSAGTGGTIELGGYVGNSVALGSIRLVDATLKLNADVTAGLNDEKVLTSSATFSESGNTQLVGNGAPTTFTIDTTNGGASTSGANATFAGHVDGAHTGLEALRVNAGTASIAIFNGQVGSNVALMSLTTAASSTGLNGGSVTTTGAQTYSDPVVLGTADTLISTGAGNITFAGTVDGAFGLTVNTAGAEIFGGAVGAIQPLTALIATGGSIAFGGPITIAGNLSLEATSGNITQNGAFTVSGASSFTTDAANAAITLMNPANVFSGAVTLRTAANGFASLTNGPTTTLASAFVGGNLTIDSTGGDLTLAGDIVAVNASLNAAGPINQTGGVIVAGNLSGSSGGGATFGNANNVGTFGSFTNASSGDLTFVDAVDFSTIGTLSSAGSLFLAGPGIDLAGNADAGGMISVVSNGPLAANGSLAMSAALIKLGGTSFTQAGTLAITAPVLEIETGSGLTQGNLGCDQCTTPADIAKIANIGNQDAVGPITFQNLSARETNVLIWAGAGTVTGTIDVKGLGMAGAGGSADLAGTINGLASIAAANLAIKGPKADSAYRINDCVIATPNCIVLPQIVPVLPLPTNLVNLLQVAPPTDPLDIERVDTGNEDQL